MPGSGAPSGPPRTPSGHHIAVVPHARNAGTPSATRWSGSWNSAHSRCAYRGCAYRGNRRAGGRTGIRRRRCSRHRRRSRSLRRPRMDVRRAGVLRPLVPQMEIRRHPIDAGAPGNAESGEGSKQSVSNVLHGVDPSVVSAGRRYFLVGHFPLQSPCITWMPPSGCPQFGCPHLDAPIARLKCTCSI